MADSAKLVLLADKALKRSKKAVKDAEQLLEDVKKVKK